MQFRLIIISLAISFSSFAEVNKNEVLSSLFDACMNNKIDVCEEKLTGNKRNIDFFLQSIKSINSYTAFKNIFIKTYGQNEFDEYSSEFTMTLLPLSSADYTVEAFDSNKIIFRGPSNKKISLANIKSSWVIDLDNSSITPPANTDTTAMSTIANLLIGSQLGLTKLIKKKPDYKIVYQTGKLYHLTVLYDMLDPEQQSDVKDIFEEQGTDLVTLKNEILTHVK